MQSLMNINFPLEKFDAFTKDTFGHVTKLDEAMITSMIQLHDTYATCRVVKNFVRVEVTDNGDVKYSKDARELCFAYVVYITGNHEYTGMLFNLYDTSGLNINKKWHAELVLAPTGETKITKKYALPESQNDHVGYLIQPLHDATIVTLYYNFGSLNAASSKSINILPNHLFVRTFQTLFSDIIELSTNFTPDKCPCVVAFRHPELQPRADERTYSILEKQIRSDDVITTEVYTGFLVDTIPVTPLSEYGFVLRDNSGYTIYESELFQFMKKTYYSMSNNIISTTAYRFNAKNGNIRKGLLLLRALCNRHSLANFKSVFPSLVSSLDKLQTVLDARVENVHTYCRTGSSNLYYSRVIGDAIGKLYTSASIETVRDFMYDKSNFINLASLIEREHLA